jgi:hypothetical protein
VNSSLEELFSSQRFFSVPDGELRASLRAEAAELVLPRLAAFLEAHRRVDFSSHRATYERLDLATVEAMLARFFEEEPARSA